MFAGGLVSSAGASLDCVGDCPEGSLINMWRKIRVCP